MAGDNFTPDGMPQWQRLDRTVLPNLTAERQREICDRLQQLSIEIDLIRGHLRWLLEKNARYRQRLEEIQTEADSLKHELTMAGGRN